MRIIYSVESFYRYIFARPMFYKFNKLLFNLSIKGLGILNFENNKVSGEKYLINKFLPKLLDKDNPILFDVGANIGNYTNSLLLRFPNAQVHSFEPHPNNYSRLCNRTKNGNVKFYNIALGDNKKSQILYDISNTRGSAKASLYEKVISEIHKQDVVKFNVQVETLDEIADKEGIRYIDFLKIDAEGNELSVLKGAFNLLKSGSIGCIHFEFNEMNIVSRVFFRDFRLILNRYEFYRLLPSGLILLSETPLSTELFAFQNIIAIPKTKKFMGS